LASWPRWPRAVRRRSWRSLRRPPFFDVLGSFFCYIYMYIYVYICHIYIYHMYMYISYVHVYIICIYVHSSLYLLFKVISNTEKTRYWQFLKLLDRFSVCFETMRRMDKTYMGWLGVKDDASFPRVWMNELALFDQQRTMGPAPKGSSTFPGGQAVVKWTASCIAGPWGIHQPITGLIWDSMTSVTERPLGHHKDRILDISTMKIGYKDRL
jgi:hypothetical protein